MSILKVVIFLSFSLLSFLSMAQNNIPLGIWRTHVSYQNTFLVEAAQNEIYCASERGLFSYSLEENSTQIFSKVNELSDVGITAMDYNSAFNALVLGYENGNIDILFDDEIVNVRLILNARFNQKKINRIFSINNLVYFCTDFGVMVFDLQQEEIKETYANLSPEGEEIAIYDGLVLNDSMYLATEIGLLSVSNAATTNRQDFNNWSLIFKSEALKHLAVLENLLYFTVDNDGIFEYLGNTFNEIGLASNNFNAMSSQNGSLFIGTENELFTYDGTLNNLPNNEISSPQELWQNANGIIYLADKNAGLLMIDGNTASRLSPKGLEIEDVATLSDAGNQILALPSAFNNNRQPLSNNAIFAKFTENSWQLSNEFENPPPNFQDIVATSYDPFTNNLFLAGYDNSLIQWNLANNTFSVLENTPFSQPNLQGNLTGISVDALGRLWAIVYGVDTNNQSVFLLEEGNWRSFTFDENITRFPLDIVADDFGNQWIRLTSGLLVMDGNGDYVILNAGSTVNALPDSEVLSIANDKESRIWVGTARGVVEFFTSDIATLQTENASATPIYESRQLLREERVTSILVDGGNRKWLGTRNGLWLFNESGTELIAFYDAQNSPLFSSAIKDVAIDDESGEVFILTSKGVLSYRSDATAGAIDFNNVKVFPNPVREDFNGLISINGLASNASVKITDVNGKLIWDTFANGGTATWDARNYNGEKAKTGIYLIYTASEDGSTAYQGKIAVIE